MQTELRLKYILLSDCEEGNSIVQNLFVKDELENIAKQGVTTYSKSIEIANRRIKIILWEPKVDLAQDLVVRDEILSGLQAGLFLFSFSNRPSFDMIKKQLHILNISVGALIGISSDQNSKAVENDELKKLAAQYNIIFTEIKTNEVEKVSKILTKLSRALKDIHEKHVANTRPKLSELHKIVRANDYDLALFCIYGEVDRADALGKAPKDINIRDHRGMTPLHVAASIGNLEFTKLLIEAGANINGRDKDQQTPLHIAAAQGHEHIIEYLLSKGAKQDLREKGHLSYAGVAAREGNLSILKLAIERGADPLEVKDLDLVGRQLKELPDFPWEKLESLRFLDLEGNSLEFIPSSLCLLPQLERVQLDGNPMRTIPPRFRSPWPVLRDYIKSVALKAAKWNEMKLLFVGQEGVGKTTLLKTLRSKRHKVSCKENLSTDGIEIHANISLSDSSDLKFTAWDLGGQEIYYPSHQFFLASNSIFLIVFNLCDPNFTRIDYWMNQIKTLNKEEKSPVLIIGTHADDKRCSPEFLEMTAFNIKSRYPRYKFRGFVDMIPVSCKTGSGVKQVIDTIVSTSLSGIMPILPESWINFSEFLKSQLQAKDKKDYVGWSTYSGWSKRCGVAPDTLRACTDFLCDNGALMYFDDDKEEDLSDIVVLNPQFLADIMAQVITFRHHWVKKGKLRADDIPQIFLKYEAHMIEPILSLLTRFQIIYKIQETGDFLVPSLLPEEAPNIQKYWENHPPKDISEFRRIYAFSFLPNGFFGRTIVRVLHIKDVVSLDIWRNGVLIKFFAQKALILFTPETGRLEISIRVPKGNFSSQLLIRIVEVIESLINGYYPKLKEETKRLVGCVHCIHKNNDFPFEFSYVECIHAITINQPFLFCHHIKSPSRCVRIDTLAPDVALTDFPRISNESLEIGAKLGSGGFGVVFKGIYKSQKVAIKELRFVIGDESEKEEKFRDFQQETWIMSFLSHPNLVKLIGITLSPLRIVMELVEGGDLFNFMHPKNGNLPQSKSFISEEEFPMPIRIRIALDIALGMRYLQHGINPPVIHRDLRSPNIFLVDLNPNAPICAKVADFGLAKMVNPDISGSLGTWQWLAPEVIDQDNKFYDERSDVYSFGIILWELYTSSIPFIEYLNQEHLTMTAWDGAGNEIKIFKENEIRDCIIKGNLRPTIPPSVPPVMADIMTRCWSPDPDLRPTFIEIVKLISNFMGVVVDELDTVKETEENGDHLRDLPADYNSDVSYDHGFSAVKRIEVEAKIRCMTSIGNEIWVSHIGGILSIWDAFSFSLIKKIEASTKSVCNTLISVPPNVWGAFEDGTIRVYDKTYEKVEDWDAHPCQVVKSLVTSQHKNNTYVWSGSPSEKSIKVWNAADFSLKTTVQSKGHSVFCMEKHGDFIWVGGNGEIFLYRTDNFSQRGSWRVHDSSITVLLSCGNRIWSGSATGEMKVWEDKGGEELLLIKSLNVHCAKILSLATQTVDGQVWSGSLDKSIIVWDSTNLVAKHEIVDHKDSISSIVRQGLVSMWTASEKTIIVYHSLSAPPPQPETQNNNSSSNSNSNNNAVGHSPPSPNNALNVNNISEKFERPNLKTLRKFNLLGHSRKDYREAN